MKSVIYPGWLSGTVGVKREVPLYTSDGSIKNVIILKSNSTLPSKCKLNILRTKSPHLYF